MHGPFFIIKGGSEHKKSDTTRQDGCVFPVLVVMKERPGQYIEDGIRV